MKLLKRDGWLSLFVVSGILSLLTGVFWVWMIHQFAGAIFIAPFVAGIGIGTVFRFFTKARGFLRYPAAIFAVLFSLPVGKALVSLYNLWHDPMLGVAVSLLPFSERMKVTWAVIQFRLSVFDTMALLFAALLAIGLVSGSRIEFRGRKTVAAES